MTQRFVILAVMVLLGSAAWQPVAADSAMPVASPEEVGLSADRLKRVDEMLEAYVSDGKLAGASIAIIRNGKLAYRGAAGWADKEAGKPIADDTIYRIYSMTKPITSVAVMMLVEEGRIKLSDPVSVHLPEFADAQVFVGGTVEAPEFEPVSRPVTIRDLLTHTAGLTYAGDPEKPVSVMYQNARLWETDQTSADFSAAAGKLPLVDHPGNRFEYGISTDILGRVVEVASDQTFDVFLKERIFDPLGMIDTSFHVPAEKRDRFAVVYTKDEDGALVVSEDRKGASGLSRWDVGSKFLSGGGGLASTMDDYLRFCQMLLNNGILDGERILSRKTIDLMMADHLGDADPGIIGLMSAGYGFGLGGAVLRDVAASGVPGSRGEFFWAGAATTYFFVDRQEGIAAVLMTQFMPASEYPMLGELKTVVYQALDD